MAVYSAVDTDLWQGLKFLPVTAPVLQDCTQCCKHRPVAGSEFFFRSSHNNASFHLYDQNWPILQKIFIPEILRIFRPVSGPVNSTLTQRCTYTGVSVLWSQVWIQSEIFALYTVLYYQTWFRPVHTALKSDQFFRSCNRGCFSGSVTGTAQTLLQACPEICL